eukprot:961813-Rhodomonas_salina.4
MFSGSRTFSGQMMPTTTRYPSFCVVAVSRDPVHSILSGHSVRFSWFMRRAPSWCNPCWLQPSALTMLTFHDADIVMMDPLGIDRWCAEEQDMRLLVRQRPRLRPRSQRGPLAPGPLDPR